jgi:hypothetical protein
VVIVFTFAQWECDKVQAVTDMVHSELTRVHIPIPKLLFIGDAVDGEPVNWFPHLMGVITDTSKSPWPVDFRFRALDPALLGNDSVALSELQTEITRIAELEERRTREHHAAVEAARIEQERLRQAQIEAEQRRQAEITKAETDRIAAEQAALAFQREQQAAIARAKLEVRIQQAKVRLAEEELMDLQFHRNGILPESWFSIEELKRLKRMTTQQCREYLNLPPEGLMKLRRSQPKDLLFNRWRIPEDLLAYVS